ncbi:hypothetical protein QVD17_26624 [Tagetes erecta]|uniref:Uncharacterized protein n=1 Tax=Tagetes erecta TaxID=13708 RepID=A0AAD8NIR2_TARER|nr:hypothetical protein QVD17_26624 [Tagetes erecta]
MKTWYLFNNMHIYFSVVIFLEFQVMCFVIGNSKYRIHLSVYTNFFMTKIVSSLISFDFMSITEYATKDLKS